MEWINKVVKSVFWWWVSLISLLIWLIGLFFVFMKDTISVIIALSFFCFILFLALFYIVSTLYKISNVKSWKKWYNTKAFFIKFEQINDNKIIYESYKNIQVTAPILTEAKWWFSWSGTHLPKIESDLQKVENIIEKNWNYDSAILKFEKPVNWNNSTILHFRAECDDSDKKSLPYSSALTETKTDIIVFRVILRNKNSDYSVNWKISKLKKWAPEHKKELLKEIPFDKETKSYEYTVTNPENDYYYILSWNK